MGSNSSKVTEGGILIELEKPYYYPGETVVGKLYLNFNQNFKSHGIELGLEVEEFGCFKEQKRRKNRPLVTSTNPPQSHTHHNDQHHHHHNNINNNNNNSAWYSKMRTGKRILFKSSQIIITFFNNLIQSGQYVYPFSFMLPPNLPGSFEYYDLENAAYIKYILQAKALSSGSSNHIKNEIIVIVRQSPQFFQYPTRLSDTKNISTWCCFSKGTSTLNISYEKNYYCPEEKVNVICELDNVRCQLKATCIKLALYQTIIIHDKKNRTKVLTRQVAESRYEGHYNAGQENTRTLELLLTDNTNPTRNNLDKCEHHYLFKEKNIISMLQATVKSSLIECRYHFLVTTEYDSVLCCSGRPTIEIPIIMYIPDIRPNMQLYQPNNWNPQTMPLCQINLPTYSEINGEFSGGPNVNVNINLTGQTNQNMGMTMQTNAVAIEGQMMTAQINGQPSG